MPRIVSWLQWEFCFGTFRRQNETMKVLLALLAVGASAQNGLQAMADAADDNSPIPAGLKSQIQGELGGALQAGGIPDSGDACLQVSGEQCPNGWAARGDGRCCATRGAFLSLKAGGPTLNVRNLSVNESGVFASGNSFRTASRDRAAVDGFPGDDVG